MWNPTSDCVLISRDVIWLKRMFFENERTEVVEVGPSVEEGTTLGAEDGTKVGSGSIL